MIISVVVGVYFLKSLTNLRADRLEVVSQLKATQVKQSIQYIYYQVLWLSQKESVTTPLTNYRAGNNSEAVFSGLQGSLDQFLATSETFAAARIYDLNLNTVSISHNAEVVISQPVEDALYPLAKNESVPYAVTSLNSSNAVGTGIMTGPISNSSESNSSEYFFGITVPIYSNTSIIINSPAVAGYLTVISNAQTIQNSLDYLTLGYRNGDDYFVVAVKAIYTNSTVAGLSDYLIGFEAVFPVENAPTLQPEVFYNINLSESVRRALTKATGVAKSIKSLSGLTLAIGFTRVPVDSVTYWSVLIEQRRSKFLAPVNQLKNIMIGVVIGTGAFMCLVTFPLAVWFINPISKLKAATEAITQSKKHKDQNNRDESRLRVVSASASPQRSQELEMHDRNRDNKRNSVNSFSTNSTAYSTGIRLPAKITVLNKFIKDELTELSDAFNIMTEELEKQYTHLEDRVRSRTKELEASKIEAEAANEAKTVFIANISHELRTPLNGILGMTSIAMDETDQLQIQDSLKLIHRSGELLLHILTELLTYSKNTLNRSKLERSNFQILEILYQVRSIFGKLTVDQRVNFKVTLKPNALRKLILYGDSNRIIQVVMNLVSNSLKFTPVDGSVDVTFKLLGEYDAKRSKENDYEKVYVKKACENGDEIGHRTGSEHKVEPHDASSNVDRAANGDLHASLEDSDLPTLGNLLHSNDDIHSILTLSTTQFENAVFQSQFSNSKPLPAPPVDLNPTSSQTLFTSTDAVVGVEDLKIRPPAIKVPVLEAVPSIDEQNFSEGNAPVGEILEERPPLLGGQPHQNLKNSHSSQGRVSSRTGLTSEGSMGLTAQITNSELVKNEKIYRMRKLYVPRSWVIQIEVLDTGSGIEPALQEKVFEPFIQGDQTLSRSYGGTGLGLSICRQLAKMMHGTLTLKSTLGKGSTFTFTLPLLQSGEIVVPESEMEEFSNDEFNPHSKVNRKVAFDINESAESEGSSPQTIPGPDIENNSLDKHASSKFASARKFSHRLDMPNPRAHLMGGSSTGTVNLVNESVLKNLSHLKILVAEDNSVNQEVVKRMLRLEGFTDLTMAANGAEAVEHVQRALEANDQYDLIFMDVQMPKMDGLTATKLIRNNLKFRKPIIALTAFADESNVKECLNSGMSGFLSKPIKRTNMKQIITEFASDLLSEIVTTPITYLDEDDRRLGYGHLPVG